MASWKVEHSGRDSMVNFVMTVLFHLISLYFLNHLCDKGLTPSVIVFRYEFISPFSSKRKNVENKIKWIKLFAVRQKEPARFFALGAI